MSFAERVKASGARIVVLDVERMKGKAEVEFWDLGDFKHRRLHAEDVTLWPRTILVAWKWLDGKRVEAASEWGDGREAMLRAAWEVYNDAHVVIGHNLDSFDTKKLKAEWALMGLTAPAPWKSVDTLKVARREFGFESNTLASLTTRFGITSKNDRYDVEVARAALDGDVKAQRRITRYCKGDVVANEGLYLAQQGWNPTHPHMGVLVDDEKRCPQCMSTNLERRGNYLANLIEYARYRCLDCGGWLRASHERRMANVRGVR